MDQQRDNFSMARKKKVTIKDLLVFAYMLITKGSIVNILKPTIKEP